MSRKTSIDRDNPEWTKADFAKAKKFAPGTSLADAAAEMIRARGRPKLANPKEAIKLRIDVDVLNAYRRSGPGWQTRINADLRKASGVGKSKKRA
jgi:uncharacterized protein (DUF4415 family)